MKVSYGREYPKDEDLHIDDFPKSLPLPSVGDYMGGHAREGRFPYTYKVVARKFKPHSEEVILFLDEVQNTGTTA